MTSNKEKKCTKCLITKPLSEFYKLKHGRFGFNSQCKKCQKKYVQNIYSKTDGFKKTTRNNNWKRNKINMNVNLYDKKIKDQNECCDLCGKHKSEFKRRLHVDHNHRTGNVRGLVCGSCNFFIMATEEHEKEITKYLNYWRNK